MLKAILTNEKYYRPLQAVKSDIARAKSWLDACFYASSLYTYGWRHYVFRLSIRGFVRACVCVCMCVCVVVCSRVYERASGNSCIKNKLKSVKSSLVILTTGMRNRWVSWSSSKMDAYACVCLREHILKTVQASLVIFTTAMHKKCEVLRWLTLH